MAESFGVTVIDQIQNKVEYMEMCWGKGNSKVIAELSKLAELHVALKKNKEARPLLWRILDMQYKLYGCMYHSNASILLSLGELYEAECEFDLAVQFYEEALAVIDYSVYPSHSDTLGRALLNLYNICEFMKNTDKLRLIEVRLCKYLNEKYSGSPKPATNNLCQFPTIGKAA